ncbi:MAG: agmatine deiminase family protein [Pseudomonadota bacterium]
MALTASAALPLNAAGRFHVPAEEDPHTRTFMQWPVSRRVYGYDGFLGDVQATIADIANTIAEFEPVVMLADASDHRAARRQLSSAVELWDVPTEDLWARDSGPLFAVDGAGGLRVQAMNFNGWGGKQVHRRDGQIAGRVADILGLDLAPSPLRGEPGGVDQDGAGNLIAHESSWIVENRNPGMSRAQVTAALQEAYGVDRVVWAPGVRDLDITDYHIDSLARFTGPGRILINLPDDPIPGEPFHESALETYDILQAAGFEVEVIPEPNRRRVRSDDFVASYVNYYVCNGAVVAAQFGDDATDAIARDALARHYPGRDVITLNTDALGEIGGGIHCATQQQPRP